MKSFALLICLLMLVCAPQAKAEAAPVGGTDIQQIQNTGLTTMGEYIEALKPTGFSWYYEGDATGITEFLLTVPGGDVSLRVDNALDYQDDDQGLEGASSLSGDVLNLQARVVGASWDGPELTLVKLPRGLALGATTEQLKAAIGGLEFVEMDPEEPEEDFTQAASCELMIPEDEDAWHEYYGFDFFLKDDKLAMAQMWYGTDAE